MGYWAVTMYVLSQVKKKWDHISDSNTIPHLHVLTRGHRHCHIGYMCLQMLTEAQIHIMSGHGITLVNFTHSRQVLSEGAMLNLPQGRGGQKTSQIFFRTVLFFTSI